MTRIGWLADPCSYLGGAERTALEFRAAAPGGVTVIDCPPGLVGGCDRYVINNCRLYRPEELNVNKPAFKVWHDVGPYITPEQHEALASATPICVSPLQAERMGFAHDLCGLKGLLDCELIPPAVPLEVFRKAAENAGERQGAVAVGTWMNPGKAPDAAAEWAKGNGGIDFYGDGPYAPQGSVGVDYDDLPEILARYKTFVHLPRWLEPFGRSVVEAWASGCAVVTNSLVGARWWITEAPEKLDSAAEDFWKLVLR